MENGKRFKDQNYRLAHFMDEIFVHCPKCAGKAIVKKGEEKSVLNCRECFYQSNQNHLKTEGKIKLNCPNCGEKIEQSGGWDMEKKEISIQCPGCGESLDVRPATTRFRETLNVNKEGILSGFETELWYRSKFKDGIFWAVNTRHLSYLKDYIAALIRQRNEREHFTLIEKLPAFVSSSKNRDALLKLIKKLESSWQS